jgi:hypothetical protein
LSYDAFRHELFSKVFKIVTCRTESNIFRDLAMFVIK